MVVCRSLWQDSENRVFLIKEIDRRTGQVTFLFVPFLLLFLVVCIFPMASVPFLVSLGFAVILSSCNLSNNALSFNFL